MIFEEEMLKNENIEVMRIASRRFKIPSQDKHQCQLVGLWDAIRFYDPTKCVPFKLFLSLRVKFACLKWCEENGYNGKLFYIPEYNVSEPTQSISNIKTTSLVQQFFYCLSSDEQDLITKRFYENKTLEEIGKDYNVCYETIRKRINLILEKFREV